MKNKEITKAFTLLDTKTKAHADQIEKVNKELTATRAKVDELKVRLDSAQDAVEYKQIVSEIRDNESYIEFFEKKAKGITLTPTEYKEIVAAAKTAYEATTNDKGELIIKKIEELVSLVADYDADIIEINGILKRAGELANKTPAFYDTQTFAPANSFTKQFIQGYYRTKVLQGAMPGSK